MPESTLLILGALGVLAWLLAGGWPYVRDQYVADDGPVGLGAGVTAVCPACAATVGAAARAGAASVRLGAGLSAVGRVAAARSGIPQGVAPGLRPLAVGRDQSLRLECPACGTTYAVVGAARDAQVVPAPHPPLD